MKNAYTSALLLRAAHLYNLSRFSLLKMALAGRAEFDEGCDVWASCFAFSGEGRARLGQGSVVERGPFGTYIEVERDGMVQVGPEVWFRGKYRPNVLTCFQGARISIGGQSFINGAVVSARSAVEIGKGAMLSWETTVIDSNLHPLSNDEPMETRPVCIGDHVLIGAGAMVLPGVSIGSHSVIGARSLVTADVPDHAVAAGSPARVLRRITDCDQR